MAVANPAALMNQPETPSKPIPAKLAATPTITGTRNPQKLANKSCLRDNLVTLFMQTFLGQSPVLICPCNWMRIMTNNQ